MKKLIVLALLLTACENRWWEGKVDYAKRPHQDDAVSLIWNFYQVNNYRPPTIGWIDYSDCFYEVPSFVDGQNVCVSGDTYVDDWLILLEQTPNISSSALPHELTHAALYALTGDGDSNHLSVWFQPGGDADQLKQMLIDKGW